MVSYAQSSICHEWRPHQQSHAGINIGGSVNETMLKLAFAISGELINAELMQGVNLRGPEDGTMLKPVFII